MHKQIQFKTIGMQRDLSESAFNPKFAYENRNIRIVPTDDNTLFSIVNEKGNKQIYIEGIGDTIDGTPIGQAVVSTDWIVFTTGEKDIIYKFWFVGEILRGKILYSGDLKFSTNNPIETLVFCENENIKKVYWVDGKNQPRFINIAADDLTINKWNDFSFDFILPVALKESVVINRNTIASGTFAPGVIQYAFTYFNKYGQESNIFYQSPLYYTSFNNRGASPEDKISNSFTIEINNVDKSFDYLRIYSIHRSSINSTPEVKRVVDLSINSNVDNLAYTDTGTSGDYIDPTLLFYIGGEEIIIGTISQKDNTLFLGDFILKRKLINDSIRGYFRNSDINFKLYDDENKPYKEIKMPEIKGYYPYKNQLSLNSNDIKSFKYLEWYRFGIQAQHYTGKWSEPIWIKDKRNEISIETTFYEDNSVKLPVAEFNLDNKNVIDELKRLGYTKVRPVVVYPTLNDREVICQGILCPTVYNVRDRYDNAPFAQSSWFSRPNIPYSVEPANIPSLNKITVFYLNVSNYIEEGSFKPESEYIIDGETYYYYGYKANDSTISSIIVTNSSESNYPSPPDGGIAEGKEHSFEFDSISIREEDKEIAEQESLPVYPSDIDPNRKYTRGYLTDNDSNIEAGAWAEFRHNYPIPGNDKRNSEIQCISYPPEDPYIDSEIESKVWASNHSEYFFVDQNIVTFHSPDIEFNTEVRSVDTSTLKLRIVGMVPITSTISDIDIQTSTPPNPYSNNTFPLGFYKEAIGTNNGFVFNNSSFNKDSNSYFGFRGLLSGIFWFDVPTKNDYDAITKGFVIYPWHRNGSLNSTLHPDESGYTPAMLSKKKMSNLRYSYKTEYMSKDKVWEAYKENSTLNTGISSISIFDSSENNSLVKIKAPKYSNLADINYYGNVDKVLNIDSYSKVGYPIVVADATFSTPNVLFSKKYVALSDTYSTDPVRIKYKSTPHAVFALNYSNDGIQRVLPTIKEVNGDSSLIINNVSIEISNSKPFWDKGSINQNNIVKVSQDSIITDINGDNEEIKSIQTGWFWLGELYNDNVVNRFGGTTEDALENNNWLPCGNSVSILNEDGSTKDTIKILWTEGDTYYQRYDHLKSYPSTLEDQNSVVDIVSFMCETRVNIDGRYDRNRGQTNNLTITPNNFNKLNNVYSQENNFFNYRYVNLDRLNIDNFPSSITWTKTKVAGELTDTWSNISLVSTLDLDGDKGPIRALRRFNNNLIAFQDRGLSQILYNENMQITSTEGVPIEIANSGKVSGKRYISDQIGCTNKWSVCETPYGVYFIDDSSKGIYLFNGSINNITSKLGFDSWIKKVSKLNIWNPVDFNSFITYYNKTNNEVLFINKEDCLSYSEDINQFISFYSYEETPYLANIKDKSVTINKDSNGKYKIWLHNEGDYNIFYGKYKPFSTTIVVNPDINKDKIFNTVEFRSDSWDNNCLLDTTFDTLKVWNEYQSGTSSLINKPGSSSTLKRKFRMWRATIPRDDCNNRDRMRNPWLYVKLSKEEKNTNKTILHDITVSYFE